MATSTLQKRPPADDRRESRERSSRDDRPPSNRLTLVEHLDELRRRLLICVATVVLTASLALWKASLLIAWLKRPVGMWPPRLAYFSPTEALSAYVTVGVWTGLVLALPVILYQAWMFIRPALTWKERRAAAAWVWWGTALFLAGAGAAYWVVLPWLLRFLLSIGSPTLEPVLSVRQYLSFSLGVIVSCGLVCELPLAIALLTRLGVVSPSLLSRMRPLALLILLIAAAVLTPTTDAFTLLLATVPLVLLYELSIAVSRLVVPRRPRD